MKNLKFFSYFLITIILALGLSISFQSLLAAWTAPADLPPACTSGNPGCDAPINSSNTAQSKSGMLLVNSGGSTNGLIVQSGNVGIGTISPSTKLQISGAVDINGQLTTAILGNAYNYWTTFGGATGGRIRGESTEGYLVLDGNPSGSNPRVFINHNTSGNVIIANGGGNVGIGMTSPSAKLHIQGVESESSGTLEALVKFNTSNGLVGQLYRDNNGTNNYLGMESFNVGNTVKTPIVFQEWGGNVGIGKTNPSNILDIYTTNDANARGLSLNGKEALETSGAGDTWLRLNNQSSFTSGVYTPGNLVAGGGFSTTWSIAPPANGAYFGGYVGIGTANPDANLTVNGNMSFAANNQALYFKNTVGTNNSYLIKYTDNNLYIHNGDGSIINRAGTSQAHKFQGLSGGEWAAISFVPTEGGYLKLFGNNGTNLFLENRNGVLRFINSAWTSAPFTISQAGDIGAKSAIIDLSVYGTALTVQGGSGGGVDPNQGGQILMQNTGNGYKKYMRVDSTGAWQLLNNSYTTIAQVTDGGNFYAVSKNFMIDHPLHNGKKLIHSSLEGPEIGVYYRGEAKLKNGYTEITLPDYFEALTRKENRSVLLTNIEGFDNIAVKFQGGQAIKDGKFIIYSDNNKSEQGFYWEVKAIRSDLPLLQTETNE